MSHRWCLCGRRSLSGRHRRCLRSLRRRMRTCTRRFRICCACSPQNIVRNYVKQGVFSDVTRGPSQKAGFARDFSAALPNQHDPHQKCRIEQIGAYRNHIFWDRNFGDVRILGWDLAASMTPKCDVHAHGWWRKWLRLGPSGGLVGICPLWLGFVPSG